MYMIENSLSWLVYEGLLDFDYTLLYMYVFLVISVLSTCSCIECCVLFLCHPEIQKSSVFADE